MIAQISGLITHFLRFGEIMPLFWAENLPYFVQFLRKKKHEQKTPKNIVGNAKKILQPMGIDRFWILNSK